MKLFPFWMNLMSLILSVCPSLLIDCCYVFSGINVQTFRSPVVEPVIMFGAFAGMVPTLGWKAALHSLETAVKLVTYVQNVLECGF